MSNSFGEGYVSKVAQVQGEQTGKQQTTGLDLATTETATIAGDITLGELRTVLLSLNAALLIIVPVVAWVLTERSLRPVRRAYEQQSDFVSDASHELRTPLTVMRGELDLALKKTRTGREYQNALQGTLSEVHRLEELVDDLLLLAQSDQRSLLPSFESVNIIETLQSAQKRLQPYARKHAVTVEVEPQTSQLQVAGSQTMLERLFTNIISNAIKYSDKSNIVTIRLSKRNDVVHITITDHGRGMTKLAVKRAFDRFYRESYSRSDEGIGLGLAISKSITEKHHGTLQIDSSKGNGTTVTIRLPLIG
jgi:signal transduction histidine kinase